MILKLREIPNLHSFGTKGDKNAIFTFYLIQQPVFIFSQ